MLYQLFGQQLYFLHFTELKQGGIVGAIGHQYGIG